MTVLKKDKIEYVFVVALFLSILGGSLYFIGYMAENQTNMKKGIQSVVLGR